MSKWTNLKLGDVLNLKRGYDLPRSKRCTGTIPIVSSSGISDFHNVAKVKAPGVITGRYGTIGEVFYVDQDYWPLNTTLYVEDFKGNDPLFISYFLKTIDYQAYAAKSAVPGINRNDIHLAEVCIPPIAEQKKIASILSAYDSLISNNRRRIIILESLAKRLYQDWFIDFELYQNENTEFIESVYGFIPKGWRFDIIGTLIDYQRGKSYTSKELIGDQAVSLINLKNIQSYGGFRADGIKQFSGKYKNGHIVKNGDIIVAVTDMTQERRVIGQAARVSNISNTAIITMDLVKIIPKSERIKDYIYSVFRYSGIATQIAEFANGANVLHLNPELIKNQVILIPPEEVMINFSNKCAPIYNLIDKLYAQIYVLSKTREHLIPRLISGDIDVSNLDI